MIVAKLFSARRLRQVRWISQMALTGATLWTLGFMPGLFRPAFAQDEDVVSFGIRPTQAFPDRPETFSYFHHELLPGVEFHDEALVINGGDIPLRLKLYSADGISAVNGGTTFALEGEDGAGLSRGVRDWIRPSVSELTLAPGEERVVPFMIRVPADVSPGQYIGGLVLEAPPEAATSAGTEASSGFGVKVVRRVGVAVVIDLPGERSFGLEILSVSLENTNEDGSTFVIAVQNTGNVLLQAEGQLTLRSPDGELLAQIPLTMDTVLPGDSTTFTVTHPIALTAGTYQVDVVLNHSAGSASLNGEEILVGASTAPYSSTPSEASSSEGRGASQDTVAGPHGNLRALGIGSLLAAPVVAALVGATVYRSWHTTSSSRSSPHRSATPRH